MRQMKTVRRAPAGRLRPLKVDLRDEAVARDYFEAHHIKDLLDGLAQQLFLRRPADPRAFLQEALAKQQQEESEGQDNASVVLCDGACLFSLVVEYDGPGGAARKAFTRIVPAGDRRAGRKAETDAKGLLHAVWAAQTLVDEMPGTAATGILANSATPAPPCAASALIAPQPAHKTDCADQSHTTIDVLRRYLARQDVEHIFVCADADKSGDLSLEELASVFATMDNTVDMGVVRQLFEELDLKKDGKVSLQEFTQGLQSVPVPEDLGVLKGMLCSLHLDDLIATHLMAILRLRMEQGEAITTEAVRRHVCREDITTVLKVCVCVYMCVYVCACVCVFDFRVCLCVRAFVVELYQCCAFLGVVLLAESCWEGLLGHDIFPKFSLHHLPFLTSFL